VEIALSLMPSYWLLLATLVPAGIAMLSFTTTANATVQLSVSAEMRGRVMALYTLLLLGTNPIGAPPIGELAERAGARFAMAFGGAVSVLAALLVAVLMLPRGTLAAAAASLVRSLPL